MTDNFALLVFGDTRNYGQLFLRTDSKKFRRSYTDYKRTVKQSNKGQTVKRHVLSMLELLQKHICACLSKTFSVVSNVEEKLREALARHVRYWEEDEVDFSVAVAGVKKALAPRSEVTSLDRVEATWSSWRNISP